MKADIIKRNQRKLQLGNMKRRKKKKRKNTTEKVNPSKMSGIILKECNTDWGTRNIEVIKQ